MTNKLRERLLVTGLLVEDCRMATSGPDPRYQIRIHLNQISPPIWRDVIVPAEISLAWLHELIQEAMGWMDLHMHQYTHQGVHYVGDAEESFEDGIDEATVSLGQLLQRVGDELIYVYDLGDCWQHRVSLEKILPPDTPICCLQGQGACPPDDCGGPLGFMELCDLRASAGQLSQEDQERLDWFDLQSAESFEQEDVDEVNETFAKIIEHVAASGGFGVGGAPLFDGVFKPHECEDEDFDFDDEDDFEEFLGMLTGEADAPQMGLQEMEESPDEDFAEPYTDLNEDALDEFRRTMELAQTVREAQPWKALYDSDIFAVEDPETKELDVVSVMGGGKQVYAIHVHRPPTGLAFWKVALTGGESMNPESMMKMSNLVEVEFLSKAAMDDPDLALYQHTGHATPSKGRQRWVRFRTYRPRCFPWFSEAADLGALRRGMRLALRYVEWVQQASESSEDLLRFEEERALPESIKVFRLPDGAQAEDAMAWSLEAITVDWNQCGVSEPIFEPNEFELNRLAQLPVREDAWELGVTCLSNGVMTETGPVMPLVAMTVSLSGSEEPPLPELTDDVTISESEALWKSLAKHIEATGYLPLEIRTTTAEAVEMLQAFAKLAGIRVVQVEEFEMLSSLFQMLAMMPGPDDF